jgi:cytidine deaminase
MSRKFDELIERASLAQSQAYAPYSGFKVGAAILTEDGEIYSGCNVENSSYGLTICAERVALFKAISEGKRRFKSVVVFSDRLAYPCGACLQVLVEFSPEMEVCLASSKGELKRFNLRDLLPKPFAIGNDQ